MKAYISAPRESAHDRDMQKREASGLPVVECPCCGVKVTRGAGHWVPERIDEHGLAVPGHYTCQGGGDAS